MKSYLQNLRTSARSFFLISILGFSFWFFMAVPMSSHRESYVWLAQMRNGSSLVDYLTTSVSTYRPIGQALMWLLYQFMGFDSMPSDGSRQTVVQCLVYASFVFGWWLLFRAAPLKRSFALVALVTGGVLFPPYIQLFHPWGLFYSPVLATVGYLVLLSMQDDAQMRPTLTLISLALVLALWHPFASALIVAYLIGQMLDRFAHQKSLPVTACLAPLGLLVILALLGRSWLFGQGHGLLDKFDGLLVSYKTIEVNRAAAALSGLLALATAWSLPLNLALRAVVAALALVVAGWLVRYNVPVLLTWLALLQLKAVLLGRWRLTAVMAAAVLLPLGSGIGSPIYGLFAIMIAVHITALNQFWLERALSPVPSSAVWGLTAAVICLSIAQRWTDVPGLSRLSAPLLAEKERSQQLEQGLLWLQQSPHCGADVDFLETASSPKLSIQNVINREHRPPSMIEDVRKFWSTYRCGRVEGKPVVFTFGDQAVPDAKLLFELPSRHAGRMQIFLPQSQ